MNAAGIDGKLLDLRIMGKNYFVAVGGECTGKHMNPGIGISLCGHPVHSKQCPPDISVFGDYP